MWSGHCTHFAGHCSDPFPQECSYKRLVAALTAKWREEIGCREANGQAVSSHLYLRLNWSSFPHSFVLKEVEGSVVSPFHCWPVWRIIIRGAWMLRSAAVIATVCKSVYCSYFYFSHFFSCCHCCDWHYRLLKHNFQISFILSSSLSWFKYLKCPIVSFLVAFMCPLKVGIYPEFSNYILCVSKGMLVKCWEIMKLRCQDSDL